MVQVVASVLLSAFLKFLSHPNFIFKNGLFLLAWFYYVPFLFIVPKLSLKKSALAGFAYGFVSYFLFCFWLIRYDVFSALGVYALFGVYWAVIFALLQIFSKTRKYAFIFNILILFFAEFLFTKGYFAFGYGVSAYTQWKIPALTRAVRYTKIWGLDFLIIFFNCIVVANISYVLKYRRFNFVQTGGTLFFAVLFIQHVFIGFFVEETEPSSTLKTVLIQNNADPRKDGIEQYKKEIESLKRLTDKALMQYPDTQIVVWPETSVVVDVVSAFDKKLRFGRENERSEIAVDLFDYINSKKCDFILGTSFKNYNSALLFSPIKPIVNSRQTVLPNWQVYKKNHLVPFSEDFPLKGFFPEYYQQSVRSGRYWLEGEKMKLLKFKEILIGTPICFEDTFSEVGEKMAKMGADLFISLSNDSWSYSRACQMQHLAAASFCSMENGIPMIRSSNSGQTCYIDGFGRVREMIKPFSENFLYCEVEINKVK